jgi:hypothetical protein
MDKNTSRRGFLKSTGALGAISAAASLKPALIGAAQPRTQAVTSFEEYVRKSVVDKKVIDVFLNENTWAQFDPELGYIIGNYMPRDGLDKSATILTSLSNGMRTNQIYRDKPCRINTYGNSFTACNQVSDGETWQEYLAAHLGEPIRNFGVGGYGVYQSYRRMLREEQTEHSADYIILYMWGDDYFRSVLRCRYVLFYPWWDSAGGTMFHNNYWANIEMDLFTGTFVEKENLLATPQQLYKMTDADFLYETLRDDLMLQMSLYVAGRVDSGLDETGIQRLSEILGLPKVDFRHPERAKPAIRVLRNSYGFAATKYILKKAKTFVDGHGKQLMVVHFDPYGSMKSLIESGTRYDQEVVDYLKQNDFLYFDMNEVHAEDFKQFNLSLNDYMKRYLIGHYSPAGNHFFAYSIKGEIVDWLNPKPISYRSDERRMVDFQGYLPGLPDPRSDR